MREKEKGSEKKEKEREKEENKRMAMVGGGEWKTEIKRGEMEIWGREREGIIIRIFQELRYNGFGFRGHGNIIKL